MENVAYGSWRNSGQDANSRIADPQYADPVTLKLKPTSPATDAGANLNTVPFDHDGARRPCRKRPSIGAYENCPVSR